jgi:hypothetical protein
VFSERDDVSWFLYASGGSPSSRLQALDVSTVNRKSLGLAAPAGKNG